MSRYLHLKPISNNNSRRAGKLQSEAPTKKLKLSLTIINVISSKKDFSNELKKNCINYHIERQRLFKSPKEAALT